MKFTSIVTLALTFTSAFAAPANVEPDMPDEIIPGKYFVQFKSNAVTSDGKRMFSEAAQLRLLKEVAQANSATVGKKFEINNFRAYLVEGSEQFRSEMEKKNVATIHPNRVIRHFGEQANAPWGLVRISNREMTDDRVYRYNDKLGEGVDVYVIDTGVQVEHPEFEGRASWGASFVSANGTVDDAGHGTHCAGTIASKSYGVAKKAKIIAVRVLGGDGSGTTETVVSGMQWVTNQVKKTGNKKSVANMSLGGGKDAMIDQAAEEMVKSGVHLVVAAGNDNKDACNYSPARAPSALTVGATDVNDVKAVFSNKGKCVDIFGPGVGITSTWNKLNTQTISGTSMAAPHVAGVMAIILANHDFSSVADAFAYAKSISTLNHIPGSIKLAFNGIAFAGSDLQVEEAPLPPRPIIKCGVITCLFRQDCDICEGLF